MDTTIIKGKKIRTNNNNPQKLMDLWKEVLELHLQGSLYAVYYNFESNHLGDYDLLIGNEVADLPNSVELSNSTYMEIPVEGNSIENAGKTWQDIWSNLEIEAKRTYQTDFEKYHQDGTITIYLSIK